MAGPNLISLMTDAGVLDPSRRPAVDAELKKPGTTEEAALTKAGVSIADILKAKGDYYGIPTRELGEKPVPFDILRYIPEESARYYHLSPLGVEDGVLLVGITDPDNLEARDALTFISAKIGMPYKLFLITETDFDRLLMQYKGLSGEVGSALSELEVEVRAEGKVEKKNPFDDEGITETESSAITADAPVTKIVATILRHAAEGRASDIHIEPLAEQTRVRFRVDGALLTNITLPSKVHAAVVARIKVLSNMRLDEKRKPQDGRFSARVSGGKVDFRVSTFPTYYGEKVVMRILGQQTQDWKLDDIGLSPRNLGLIKAAIKKPYGMVLISGPTGSGKSTTLYTLLNEVDRDRQNVLSLEDPVEYVIPGVSQSQVRPEIGYTFANGLRTTLRQDPNIIMVGEIRDSETANLAVQAALTGHLVLSTIHTNNAVGIIPRLLDMGVEPFLIPPVVVLGIAQRLVRTLCPGGGRKVKVEGSMQEMLKGEFDDVPKEFQKDIPSLEEVYRIEPTPECPSGTKGRIACFEVFEMTPDLERSILAHQSEDEMFKIVRAQGMLTMKEDAIIKAAQGVVPFEEVNTLGGQFELPEDEEAKAAKAAAEPAPEHIEAPDVGEEAAVEEAQKGKGQELSV